MARGAALWAENQKGETVVTDKATAVLISRGVQEEDDAMKSTVIDEVTIEFLDAFAGAWNRHDIDGLMAFMTDDCVFESSAGSDVCGTRYVGRWRSAAATSSPSGRARLP